jgi:hypothetical protein
VEVVSSVEAAVVSGDSQAEAVARAEAEPAGAGNGKK